MSNRPFPIGTVLFFLFSVFTLLEIWVLVLVTKWFGLGATIVLTFGTALAGAALAKREGISVVRRAQRQLANGQLPARPLAEGVMILLGGALLLTPGLITDVIGFTTLIPPCRRFYGRLALRWAARHFQMVSVVPRTGPESQIVEPWPKKEDN